MARVWTSLHYVLPNHMMIKISSELLREMQAIMACCNLVPPMVRQNPGALHSIILAARDMISSPPLSEMADFTNNFLQSPLDLSHLEDSGGDLETEAKNKFTFVNNNLV